MSPAEREECARVVLPADVYDYYRATSGQESTLVGQARAWQEVLLRPRLFQDVSQVSTATTVLGLTVAGPVLVAPTAGHGLAHPDGEVATARGVAAAGSVMVLSMRASSRIEAVAAEGASYWQQIYVLSDRGVSDEVATRAAAAGAAALVLTADTPFVARKSAGAPASLPLQGIIEALDRRRSSDVGLRQVPVRADDIGRLARLTGLPVVVKGVLRGDEAARCLDHGATAVIVSTHGGRQLEGVVPSPRALADVVGAIGDDAEVYVDGGIRTGVDVVRALGLGATAVLLGRPVLWALSTGGAEGVRELLESITHETAEAMALVGCPAVQDVGPDLVAFR